MGTQITQEKEEEPIKKSSEKYEKENQKQNCKNHSKIKVTVKSLYNRIVVI